MGQRYWAGTWFGLGLGLGLGFGLGFGFGLGLGFGFGFGVLGGYLPRADRSLPRRTRAAPRRALPRRAAAAAGAAAGGRHRTELHPRPGRHPPRPRLSSAAVPPPKPSTPSTPCAAAVRTLRLRRHRWHRRGPYGRTHEHGRAVGGRRAGRSSQHLEEQRALRLPQHELRILGVPRHAAVDGRQPVACTKRAAALRECSGQQGAHLVRGRGKGRGRGGVGVGLAKPNQGAHHHSACVTVAGAHRELLQPYAQARAALRLVELDRHMLAAR